MQLQIRAYGGPLRNLKSWTLDRTFSSWIRRSKLIRITNVHDNLMRSQTKAKKSTLTPLRNVLKFNLMSSIGSKVGVKRRLTLRIHKS